MASGFIPDLSGLTLPPEGEITLCEVDGKVQTIQPEFAHMETFCTVVTKYPKIHISRDTLHRVGSGEEGRALFLPVHESFIKQLVQIYYEHGILEVLRTTAERRENSLVATSSVLILKLINSVRKIRTALNPYAKESGPKLISLLSQTRSWQTTPVRCVCWHELFNKLAVATSDDSVRLYSEDSTLVPILKSRQQKNITCIAWRPLSGSEIAVGCDVGVFVWNVDPCSSVARPSINHATILKRVNHCPVMTLCWSPLGDVLTTGAALDGKIYVWNVELNQTSTLKKPGSNGTVVIKYSPDGSKMFVATTGLVFYVWDCNKWQAERWNVLTGRISSACWSPNGAYLLFTTTDEPTLYYLPFSAYGEVFNATNSTPEVATAIVDLSKTEIDDTQIGGIVQKMDWDKNGTHLAVMFRDTNAIAIFVSSLRPNLQLAPGFLISGLKDEAPVDIDFQKNFKYGACLTIAWSSGRVQYFPIIYSESNFGNSSRCPNLSKLNSSAFEGSLINPNSFYVVA